MKNLLFIFIFIVLTVNAQSNDTIGKPIYFRINMISLTSDGADSIPTISDRIMQNVEIGKSLGVADVGISFGAISSKKSGNTKFIESKVNLDTFQAGIFSNEITLGVGYVFNSKTPILIELSSTIFCQIDDKWGLGVVYGYDTLIGDYREKNINYIGLYFRFGLLRDDGGVITNKFKRRIKNRKRNIN